MKEIGRIGKNCGTLRDLCVTLKSKVPQDKHQSSFRLEHLRDPAGPSLYYVYARTRTHAHAHVVAVGIKVPQGHARGLNTLNDRRLGCGTYPKQGPAKVPQIGAKVPQLRGWTS